MDTSPGFEQKVPPSGARAVRADRYRILVIDNEPTIARVVARILGASHDVECCVHVDAACERVRGGETFDVILCDFLMPDRDGQDFHRYLTKFAPELADRVVFITGAASLPSTRAYLDLIPNVALEKPFSRAALVSVVLDVGGRSRERGAASAKAWAC
jgi:CheY-like chemotaxis protein